MFHYRTGPTPPKLVHIVQPHDDARALCGMDVSQEPWTDKPVTCPQCAAVGLWKREQEKKLQRLADAKKYIDAARVALIEAGVRDNGSFNARTALLLTERMLTYTF